MLVRLPQPYDFELSTARFDVYGRDRATLWRDGGIHRFFAGREVRIEAAPGGVDVTPHDEAIEAEVLHFLGLPFDLDGFYALGGGRRDPRPARDRARRLPPAAAGRTRSRRSSPRSRRSRSRSSRRPRSGAGSSSASASRRARVRLPGARTGRARDRGRADRRRLLDPQGRVRRRARSQRPRPGRARLAARRGGDGAARRAARARGMDGRLVPRPPPREAACVARRRPGSAQGGHRVLW